MLIYILCGTGDGTTDFGSGTESSSEAILLALVGGEPSAEAQHNGRQATRKDERNANRYDGSFDVLVNVHVHARLHLYKFV